MYVCKLFHGSSMIDQVFHVIHLLYHLYFETNSQNHTKNSPIESIYTRRMYFLTKCQKFALSYFKRYKMIMTLLFFTLSSTKTGFTLTRPKMNIMSKIVV